MDSFTEGTKMEYQKPGILYSKRVDMSDPGECPEKVVHPLRRIGRFLALAIQVLLTRVMEGERTLTESPDPRQLVLDFCSTLHGWNPLLF
jgi:hypothetical protein